MIASISSLVASWADWYGDSIALSVGVTTLHLGGMLLAGGLAIAADRSTLIALAAPRGLAAHLDSLAGVHRPVLWGLALTIATGLGMLAADLDALIAAPVFWVKMGMLAVLLANGGLLRITARHLRARTTSDRLQRRLRRASIGSAVLWFTLLVLGAALPAA